ncbi:MAG: metal ABC transporter ATP-binding protein [Oscillospiraceae bacterium]|nr:metal ABC transporter ATP-binding protein [Oscillospiraceae bacterium]
MIRAKELHFSYTGTAPYILNGIDFEMLAGEYISVVGDNGSGKTTLMRLILKMIKPGTGSIASSAQRTGYVPQRNSGADSGFPITVHEMLNSYRKLLKVPDKNAVRENLKLVSMSGFENALTRTLSGGQSQKMLIARALMGEPDLLVLDEPSTGIDSASREDIYRILKALNQTKGMTIISVEHNLRAAVSNSSRIYHLSGGRGHICTPEQYVAEYMNRPGEFGDV